MSRNGVRHRFAWFVSVARGRVRLYLSEHTGDARPNTLIHLNVKDVDAIAAEFGVSVDEEGLAGRECALEDPDGNRLRVATPRPAPELSGSLAVCRVCCCCSGSSDFGEPLLRLLAPPAGVHEGGVPRGPRLRGSVVRVVVEPAGVVRQHQVEIRDVDARIVPIDNRDPIRGQTEVARTNGVRHRV